MQDEGHAGGSGSQLFTVRMWREAVGCGRSDWRGEVRHVMSGERRYFRDWSVLEAFLLDSGGKGRTPAAPARGG